MKAQSPAHRKIQLNRKTEKLVIPKMSCDLTNKENNLNFADLFETSKSKNNSSKKNSLEKKSSAKKLLNLTHNALKCTLKKIGRNQIAQQDKKQLSLEKKEKKKRSKDPHSFATSPTQYKNSFAASMGSILKKAKKRTPTASIKQNYSTCFEHTNPESKKQLLSIMEEHIYFWVDRCENLEQMLAKAYQQTPKMEREEEEDEESPDVDTESQVSICSYIADPKQQIKMNVRKQLQQLLHLDFHRVEILRNKQL